MNATYNDEPNNGMTFLSMMIDDTQRAYDIEIIISLC
jgi:hypothetical protein